VDQAPLGAKEGHTAHDGQLGRAWKDLPVVSGV